MQYYLLRQDLMARGAPGIRGLPDEIDPLDWMRGKVMPAPASPLRLTLSDASGDDFRGDLIDSLVSIASDKLKSALTAFGVDNVDYFPVELVHPRKRVPEPGYWLVNVVGRVNCVDVANSTVHAGAGGRGVDLESFKIDEARAPEQPIFRLDEDPTLIVITEQLKEHLEAAGLAGVKLQPTEDFDGF